MVICEAVSKSKFIEETSISQGTDRWSEALYLWIPDARAIHQWFYARVHKSTCQLLTGKCILDPGEMMIRGNFLPPF